MAEVIDLNSDLGEGAGYDEEILSLVSSANISCGFHAGNPSSILATIRSAKRHGVAVGAHPSFDDRENFGRREMEVPAAEVSALVAYQIGAFAALCELAGAVMEHIKPHGALYNMAARDRHLSAAVAGGIAAVAASAWLFVLPKSRLEEAAHARSLKTAGEFFADRAYQSNGELVPRTDPEAVLCDPSAAAERVVRLLREGVVRTIDHQEVAMSARTVCVHGDTPGAVNFVRELRARLERENIRIAAPRSFSDAK